METLELETTQLFPSQKSSASLGSALPKPNCYITREYSHGCKPQKVGRTAELLRHLTSFKRKILTQKDIKSEKKKKKVELEYTDLS